MGENCQIYQQVTIGNNGGIPTIGNNVEICAGAKVIGPITIGDDCWLGGGVIVCPGVTIGNRCIIAAGSVVTRDIPDDSLAAGNPAVIKKTLNKKD